MGAVNRRYASWLPSLPALLLIAMLHTQHLLLPSSLLWLSVVLSAVSAVVALSLLLLTAAAANMQSTQGLRRCCVYSFVLLLPVVAGAEPSAVPAGVASVSEYGKAAKAAIMSLCTATTGVLPVDARDETAAAPASPAPLGSGF
jgi:hypothetical protein